MIFNRELILKLLREIDKQLSKKAALYVIGGSAANLAYDSKDGTKDIDTWNKEKAIEEAYQVVIKKFPQLKIPLGPANVQISSPEMHARFKPLKDEAFDKLSVLIPEAEDLFLMKAQRAGSKDLEDLDNLHKNVKLNSKIILERFKNEILPLNAGDDELLKDRFLSCVDRVFGEKTATSFAKALHLK